jgi:hypothetical protein
MLTMLQLITGLSLLPGFHLEGVMVNQMSLVKNKRTKRQGNAAKP